MSRYRLISQPVATVRTQKWRGRSYALDLRGEPEKLRTPHYI